MLNEKYQHYVCIVAGEQPDELMKPYDINKKVEPYTLYEYKNAKKIKNIWINEYEKRLMSDNISKMEIDYINEAIDELKEMSDDEFFECIVLTNKNTFFDPDGNIKSNINQNGKWVSYNLGKIYSIPFFTKDGREVFQAKKSEIDWDKVHLSGKEIYKRVWEMVMEKSLPNDEQEKALFDNMKDKESYLENFKTKENYVVSNTAFWGYAFLSEETGWIDAEDSVNQFSWITEYYDKFIKNLSEDTILTIYECTK